MEGRRPVWLSKDLITIKQGKNCLGRDMEKSWDMEGPDLMADVLGMAGWQD